MTVQNIFDKDVQHSLVERLNKLNFNTRNQWGKMNAAQMLTHINVMWDLGLTDKYKRPSAFVRFMLRNLVKDKLINEKPYKKNSRTAPEMIIKHQPNFLEEKQKVLDSLNQVFENGSSFFNQREHPSFGKLSSKEWSNLFYKHIDHHLMQFGC